jgi:GNAT superfamily N-acetyltransferase
MHATQHIIRNSEGLACGELAAVFYDSAEDMNNAGTLRIAQLAAPEKCLWPLAIIGSIEVWRGHRGRGAGTAALMEFMKEAQHLGAKLVLLKVGHFDGSTESGRTHARRLAAWYERNGFCLMVAGGVQDAVADPLRTISCPEML